MTGTTTSPGKPASRNSRPPARRRALQVHGMADSPRGKLLSAAAHLFRKNGFERTTVRDIAALVGIQSGSLFHHFSSKEEILKAVMIDVIRFNTERLQKAVDAAGDTRAKLRALVECELRSIVGDTREAMAVLGYCWDSLTPASQKEVLALRAVYEDIWLVVLRDAQRQGLMKTDAFVMRRLLTGAISWSNTWFDAGGSMSIDDLIDTVLGMAVR